MVTPCDVALADLTCLHRKCRDLQLEHESRQLHYLLISRLVSTDAADRKLSATSMRVRSCSYADAPLYCSLVLRGPSRTGADSSSVLEWFVKVKTLRRATSSFPACSPSRPGRGKDISWLNARAGVAALSAFLNQQQKQTCLYLAGQQQTEESGLPSGVTYGLNAGGKELEVDKWRVVPTIRA